jgi:ATP-dependent DNA helicase RecG
MTQQELSELLDRLRGLNAENEIVEFKEAKKGYDFAKIGKYFSALSNEANLGRKQAAWLVFGIKDKTHNIVGSQFRPQRTDLDNLKKELADKVTPRTSFVEVYE